MENKNTVRENIIKKRNALGWTQADLAERINMKTSTYATKEAKGNFKTNELWLIADALNIDIKSFFIYENSDITDESLSPLKLNDNPIEFAQTAELLPTAKEKAIIQVMRSSKQNKNVLLSIMDCLHQKEINQEKLDKIIKILNED